MNKVVIQKMRRVKLITLIIFVASTACISKKKKDTPLEFELPLKSFELPTKLNEASGLAHFSSQELALVNDEEGIIYFFNLKEEKVSRSIQFTSKGDFEGITVVNNDVYILESNGKVFIVSPNEKVRSFQLLNNKFDLEGLCFHETRNSLLIACKERFNKKKDDNLWIYEYSLAEKKMKKKPYLKIARSKISKNFRPSGIVLNSNGNLIITSAVNEMIVELGSDNKVVKKVKLPKKTYPQVEGVSLNNEGNLFIVSEKAGMNSAMLYKIRYL